MMAIRQGRLLMAGAVLVVTGLLAWGVAGRGDGAGGQRSTIPDNPVQSVHLVEPTRAPSDRAVDLPGTIKAWYTAPIYAQVSGYVQAWYKDYGAAVKGGDLLATIATPGLDEQFAAAKSNLEAAQDKYRIAALTARRWRALSGTQAVSKQEVDVQVATAQSEAAQVQAAGHDVARFEAMERFKRVVAPFGGVVTARNTDVGNYVNAAGGDPRSQGGSSELFSVADIHKMRVFVSVPQDYAAMLKPGLTATLSLLQFPGRSFTARFEATANAFDAQTRTVVTELVVDNPHRAIWPGTYADVHFTMSADPNVLIVPEESLLFNAQGMQLALVGADSKVHLRTVTVGLNLGQTVQVVAGLKPTDRFIDNPSAGLLDGEPVDVMPDAPSEMPSGSSRAKPPGEPKHLTSAQREKIEAARAGAVE